MAGPDKTGSVPLGAAARARVAGKAALRVGVGRLGHALKRPFLAPAAARAERAALEDAQAALVFDALAQLRGTALKAAQMLAMEMEWLPPAYQQQLARACHQVPPLNRVLVRKVIQDDLGAAPETLFRHFEWEAFAAASLGQVHRAELSDGTPVAVKVQYPGIAVAIDSDMVLLGQMVRRLPGTLANGPLLAQSLTHVHGQLREEVDYRLEAAATQWGQTQLAPLGVQVPRVHGALSGRRVLTTDLMPGQHLDAWLASEPSQAERDRAALSLYRCLVAGVRHWGRIHADPNPGNYLFLPGGQVALLDFGCMKTLSPVFCQTFPRILAAYRQDDPESLFAAYRRLDMDHGLDDPAARAALYQEHLRPFGKWLVAPLTGDYFDFGGQGPEALGAARDGSAGFCTTSYTNEGRVVMERLGKMTGLNRLAPEFLYFDRTYYGLCKVFERLAARVPMAACWVEARSALECGVG